MKAEELVGVGLPQNQADVYLELTYRPGQPAGAIAKQLSVDRSYTYSVLTSLIDKGLVSYVLKQGHKVFYPSDPEHLLKDVDEKRDKLLNIVDKLKSLKKRKGDDVRVEVYEGKAGLKKFIRELLDGGQFSTLGGGEGLEPTIERLKFEFPHYAEEFERKKIVGRTITSKKTLRTIRNHIKGKDFKMKTLSNLTSPVSFVIFESKLAIYSSTDKPFVVMLEGRGIAEALQAHFEHLWSVAERP